MQFTMKTIAALLPLVAAMPLEKRALSQNDTAVVQLAHYLENLEYSLYSGGYNKYSDAQFQAAGFGAGYRDNVGVIAQQEAVHRDTLAGVLTSNGVKPLPACTYSFPHNTATEFVSLSNMVTTVGIGAYLGGAALLMDNKPLLTDAAAILSNEARHDSFLRAGLGAYPFPTPFDTSLTALWAYNLAHQFIVSCPQEPSGVVVLPSLTLVSPKAPTSLRPTTPAGTTLSFKWDPSKFFVKVDPSKPLYVAFINQVGAPIFEQVTKTGTGTGTVPVPKNIGGFAFAALTTFQGGLTAAQLSQFGTLAGPAIVPLA